MGNLVFKKGRDTYKNVPKSFFELTAKDADGKEVDFSVYRGKKAIIVGNVASACGLTNSNYKGLVSLYNKYKDQGLEILGFPCNQFHSQETKCEFDIKAFIQKKFEAEFTLFSKIDVNGPNTHPVFVYLKVNSELHDSKKGNTKNIPWNFGKFLLDENGKVVKFYHPTTTPDKMAADIEALIAGKLVN